MIDYVGVLGECTHEYVISHSRFIATASNIQNAEDAMEFVKAVSKKYSDATHNCYAYIANPEMTDMRSSDAGEPQGTAGQPILEILKKQELACTVVVVSRYFGGIKLGTGRLAAAYAKVTKDCLMKANIVEFNLSYFIKVLVDYSFKDKLEQIITNSGGEIVETTYLKDVEIVYAVPVDDSLQVEQALMSVTSGKLKLENLYRKYYIYK